MRSYEYRKSKSSVLWKLKEKEKFVPNQVLLTVSNLCLLSFIYEFYQGPKPVKIEGWRRLDWAGKASKESCTGQKWKSLKSPIMLIYGLRAAQGGEW